MKAKLALLLAAAALLGCSSSPTGVVTVPTSSVSVPVGADFALAVGQSAIINDGEASIVLDRIIGDSRCPYGALVQCIWAGSVQLGLTLTEGGASRAATIETVVKRDVVSVGKYQLQIMSVTPERVTLDSIPSAQYRGVFRVLRK
jgi:hypothetical protein